MCSTISSGSLKTKSLTDRFWRKAVAEKANLDFAGFRWLDLVQFIDLPSHPRRTATKFKFFI